MQWANYGIRKAKENTIQHNLVGAKSLEGLDALGRLGLEGLLLFMYPIDFLVDHLPLGG